MTSWLSGAFAVCLYWIGWHGCKFTFGADVFFIMVALPLHCRDKLSALSWTKTWIVCCCERICQHGYLMRACVCVFWYCRMRIFWIRLLLFFFQRHYFFYLVFVHNFVFMLFLWFHLIEAFSKGEKVCLTCSTSYFFLKYCENCLVNTK